MRLTKAIGLAMSGLLLAGCIDLPLDTWDGSRSARAAERPRRVSPKPGAAAAPAEGEPAPEKPEAAPAQPQPEPRRSLWNFSYTEAPTAWQYESTAGFWGYPELGWAGYLPWGYGYAAYGGFYPGWYGCPGYYAYPGSYGGFGYYGGLGYSGWGGAAGALYPPAGFGGGGLYGGLGYRTRESYGIYGRGNGPQGSNVPPSRFSRYR
ncbi:MAG: hypothetical protein ACYTGX_14130 [Planctomycetota bacterium]|jgi:hypothetical protein